MNIFRSTLPVIFYLTAAISSSAHTAKPSPFREWNYTTSFGQSLSVGWTAKPVVTTTQPKGLKMFKSGVRVYENGNDRSALVPLEEGENGPLGETPVSGAACRLFQLMQQQNPGMNSQLQFICSATGEGGVSIQSLGKGSGAYNRIMDDLKAVKTLADKEKKSLSMPAFIWTQGETDHRNKKSGEWYHEKMIQLINDINEDAKNVTGQKNDVICFGYQVGSHLAYYKQNPSDYPVIAIEQLKMALEKGSRYVMTTPMYHFEYNDGVHLTAPMSRLYGEYVGYVMKRVLVDGVDWKPIHPVSHKIRETGNEWVTDIVFYAPIPPMTFDTKTVDDPGNYGFSMVTEDGKPLPIKSVALHDKNVVRLVTKEDPRKSSVRYGMTIAEHRPSGPVTGARGCLRDSQGNTVKANILDKTYRMDNWCPFFDYPLSAQSEPNKSLKIN